MGGSMLGGGLFSGGMFGGGLMQQMMQVSVQLLHCITGSHLVVVTMYI